MRRRSPCQEVVVGEQMGRPEVGEGDGVVGNLGSRAGQRHIDVYGEGNWELVFEVDGGCRKRLPSSPELEGGERDTEGNKGSGAPPLTGETEPGRVKPAAQTGGLVGQEVGKGAQADAV